MKQDRSNQFSAVKKWFHEREIHRTGYRLIQTKKMMDTRLTPLKRGLFISHL